MPTYVCLANWTQKGVENIKDSPNRLDAARELFRSLDVELKDFYMTVGAYDMVLVATAPDDATMAKALLGVASKGGARTQTLRAFEEAEYRQIIGSLP